MSRNCCLCLTFWLFICILDMIKLQATWIHLWFIWQHSVIILWVMFLAPVLSQLWPIFLSQWIGWPESWVLFFSPVSWACRNRIYFLSMENVYMYRIAQSKWNRKKKKQPWENVYAYISDKWFIMHGYTLKVFCHMKTRVNPDASQRF